MIPINKEEATIIRKHLPGVCVVRTMKQKSKRGHYFCDETDQAIEFVTQLRKNAKALSEVGD